MDIAKTEAKMKAEIEEGKHKGFDAWMKQSLVRAMISKIPPNEDLEVLLRAAYESGFASGGALSSTQFIRAILSGRD